MKKLCFKKWLILLLMLFQTAFAFGEDIKTIQIITPSWDVLTNEGCVPSFAQKADFTSRRDL